MDRTFLITTARQLCPVSENAAAEYQQNAGLMTVRMNAVMEERADVQEMVGICNLPMMRDNHANHVRFITSLLKNFNPDVLVDTVLWVFRAYRSHGFRSAYWAAQLNAWVEILKEMLSPEAYEEIYPYYEWMQVNIPAFVAVSDNKLDMPNACH